MKTAPHFEWFDFVVAVLLTFDMGILAIRIKCPLFVWHTEKFVFFRHSWITNEQYIEQYADMHVGIDEGILHMSNLYCVSHPVFQRVLLCVVCKTPASTKQNRKIYEYTIIIIIIFSPFKTAWKSFSCFFYFLFFISLVYHLFVLVVSLLIGICASFIELFRVGYKQTNWHQSWPISAIHQYQLPTLHAQYYLTRKTEMKQFAS